MGRSILGDLSDALDAVDRPGTFCVSGRRPVVLPGLDVEGLGPIGLPLTAGQAKALIERCDQAPHGKGAETVVDTSVRRVWRMKPDRFSLKNPDWTRLLAEIAAEVQAELGLEGQTLASHLYDLLVYEAGGFFLPHRDGEKLDRMVATLVVALPSDHEGGELLVRHDGQERTVAFDDDPFAIRFAAFYADCEHEVRPLRRGYRLCLVYNLALAKSKKTMIAPRDSDHIETIGGILGRWSAEDPARKLAVTLEHQYTQDGLAWNALKGVDLARARIVAEAARRAGCRAYLALLTFHESGSAEYFGGARPRSGRRWFKDEYGGDAGDYEIGEIFDSSLTLRCFLDVEGNSLPIGELSLREDELLDPDELREVDPEVQFQGYTGNEGMTLERWYRHAVIVIWTERRHFEILCDQDSRRVVPVLDQMVASWRQAAPRDAEGLKSSCVELAAAILAKWPEQRFVREPAAADHLLKTLAALDDIELIRAFLGVVLIRDATVDPGRAIVAVVRKHGLAAFRRELSAVLRSTTTETLERNVRLLDHLMPAEPRTKAKDEEGREVRVLLAQELVSALEAIDREKPLYDWRAERVDRAEVLAGLARSLIAAEQLALLARVMAHARVLPETYPLRLAHVPALEILRPWLKTHVKKCLPTLAEWVGWCREQLESLTAERPQAPADFRRSAKIACKCDDCAELKRFLNDPVESEHRFRMRQDRRNHLESEIRNQKIDLGCKTDRRGSPQTLVCTKNTASYQALLKTYHEDCERLDTIRSIESELPA